LIFFQPKAKKDRGHGRSHNKLWRQCDSIVHRHRAGIRVAKKSTAVAVADPAGVKGRTSERIRARLQKAGIRFHANDNIAEYIEPGEIDELLAEVETEMARVLRSLVIDTTSDHNTQDTARRVAKMYLNEVFRGRYVAPPAVTEFPNIGQLNELMIVGPITVRSACSHHLCPIIGRVWVGVMPNEHSNLIGLSKYSRLCDWVMSRPQIQEEAVTQLSALLYEIMQPDGLALVMEADHFCMHWRGVKDSDTKMINSVMRGSFLKDANLRREFLSLLNRKSS
jgi:GTP cyclohydrolase I